MIVIGGNGRQIRIRGWRAWLMYGVAALVLALVAVILVSLFLGIALTVVTVLLFGLPILLVLALVLRVFRPQMRPMRDPRIIDHEPLPPR
jgi:Mn2+/Fe2+ NRAMP family transporter